MAENEMDELHRRASAALAAALDAASKLATVAMEFRVRQLRKAAAAGEEHARQARARAATKQAADRAIWSRTSDPAWWREADVEDISRAWRAAATWSGVDPGAEETRQAMTERLAGRGVTVEAGPSADPGDVQWLRAALDLAEAEQKAGASGPSSAAEVSAGADRDAEPAPGAEATAPGDVVASQADRSEALAAAAVLVSDTSTGTQRAAAAARVANPISTRRAVSTHAPATSSPALAKGSHLDRDPQLHGPAR